MSHRPFLAFCVLAVLGAACTASRPRQEGDDFKSDAIRLQTGFHADLREYEYPFSVSEYVITDQGQILRMAYMDARPQGNEKGAIILMHGKNFSGAYFRDLMVLLWKQGYRVIVPDQIGFGKSTKPQTYQFSFQALARNTKLLVDHLGLKKVRVLGHSMGGMLAARFALMYPERVEKLWLVNPAGLEDARSFVAYRSVDEIEQEEKKATPESIREYQKRNYFGGDWKPRYEEWIQIPIGWLNGPDFLQMARISALTTEMMYTQPVVQDLGQLKVPTVLLIGTRDRMSLGKAWAEPEVAAKMGDYRKLGKDTVKKIRGAKLIELEGVGHVPFVENLPKFWTAIVTTL